MFTTGLLFSTEQHLNTRREGAANERKVMSDESGVMSEKL
jgi:hypothetical protein